MKPSDIYRAFALPVAAAAITLPSVVGGSPGSVVASEARRPPIGASAPCSGAAELHVRLSHLGGPGDEDRLRVTVRDAKAGSRWWLGISMNDDVEQTVYPPPRANRRGDWVLIDDGRERGYLNIEVSSRSRAGQVCTLSLSGLVNPR